MSERAVQTWGRARAGEAWGIPESGVQHETAAMPLLKVVIHGQAAHSAAVCSDGPRLCMVGLVIVLGWAGSPSDPATERVTNKQLGASVPGANEKSLHPA